MCRQYCFIFETSSNVGEKVIRLVSQCFRKHLSGKGIVWPISLRSMVIVHCSTQLSLLKERLDYNNALFKIQK